MTLHDNCLVPRIPRDNAFTFRFSAVAGQSYTVDYCDSLDGITNWLRLQNIQDIPVSGDYAVTNVAPTGPMRFYRVVTPAQP